MRRGARVEARTDRPLSSRKHHKYCQDFVNSGHGGGYTSAPECAVRVVEASHGLATAQHHGSKFIRSSRSWKRGSSRRGQQEGVTTAVLPPILLASYADNQDIMLISINFGGRRIHRVGILSTNAIHWRLIPISTTPQREPLLGG